MSDTVAWQAWLLDRAPASRRQARLGRWYRAWLAFRRNGLAMTGLVVVLALVLMAVAAPLIADPTAATIDSLRQLRATGAEVVLIEDFPPAGIDPRICLSTAKVLEECRYLANPAPSDIPIA